MSDKSLDGVSVHSKTPSIIKVRDFLRKSFPQFQRFPRKTPLDAQSENIIDNVRTHSSESSVDVFDYDLHHLQEQLATLRADIIEIKDQTQKQLDHIVSQMKFEMERLEKLGEQVDDFEENVRMERDSLNNHLEEMEAKIHHQINDQYSDMQEAIERLYLRMDSLEMKYQAKIEQEDIEEKETSYIRGLIIKGVNCMLTITQVVLVVVNTLAETLRPLSSNVANICFLGLVVFAIIFFRDEEVRQVTARSLMKMFPFLKVLYELVGWDSW